MEVVGGSHAPVLVRSVALGVMRGEPLIDTGSSFCVIPTREAGLLGFNRSNRLGSVWVNVVGGTQKKMDHHRLEYVRVGTARAHRIDFMVSEMGSTHSHFMLLGLTFLRKFNVTIDFDRGEVLFWARRANQVRG